MADGAENDDINENLHSMHQEEDPKSATSIDNPKIDCADPIPSGWNQKFLAIQNSNEEVLRNHLDAIQSEFKKSIDASVEFMKELEENSETLKRANEELEGSRRKIARLENENSKLQAALDEAKRTKHECASCQKQCFKFCIECMK